MKSVWRLLGLAAAVNITVGVGTAAAQRVMVRHLPAGTPVEIVLNTERVATGTVPESGDVTIPFTLPEKDGKAEMDANVFVETCDKTRRVLIVDHNRIPPPAGEGCDRREISGIFWVRKVNTIVVDLEPTPPSLLLINGSYTPPKPVSPEEENAESRPHAPLPKGFMLFAGAGTLQFRDFLTLQCGNAVCGGDDHVLAYSFGVDYWLTRNIGVEASYMKPGSLKASGSDTFSFETTQETDIWSIVAKGGVQGGPMRIYGQGGFNFHQATLKTTETIALATQRFETQTDGWNWTWGAGLEGWIKNKFAIYGELNRYKIKGDAKGGGEAQIDDRATALTIGIRLHVGG